MNPAYLVLSLPSILTGVNPALMGWINLGIAIYSTYQFFNWLNTEPVVY